MFTSLIKGHVEFGVGVAKAVLIGCYIGLFVVGQRGVGIHHPSVAGNCEVGLVGFGYIGLAGCRVNLIHSVEHQVTEELSDFLPASSIAGATCIGDQYDRFVFYKRDLRRLSAEVGREVPVDLLGRIHGNVQ